MSINSGLRLTFVSGIAAALLIGAGSASSSELLTPTGSQTSYLPIQSISYDFASKSMRGYFLPQDGKCLVVLMITEKIDPDQSMPSAPARVRMALGPGQIASIDSEAEGSLHSLSFGCSDNAGRLVVTTGNGTEVVAVR